MKTDRELLELAAKAVGLRVVNEIVNADDVFVSFRVKENGRPKYVWSPLLDDGDALRLAVKLEMQLRLRHTENEVSVYGAPDGRTDEGVHGDPCAATRRAIVRTAAAIGEAMP